MEKLLVKVVPGGPRSVHTEDGGALLAVSLHCLMCKHGFTPVPKGLAEDWNTRFADEWVFRYRRVCCENAFVLHCSLQAPSGKMFVSAREEGNSPNTQCMGLLLGRYVPGQALASPDWRALPKEAEALEGMFTTYITSPLCATAVPSQQETGFARSLAKQLTNVGLALHRKELYIPLALVAAAAVVAIALRQRTIAAQSR